MRTNERIVQVFDLQSTVAKVRVETVHPITGAITTGTKFCAISDIPRDLLDAYYKGEG